VAPAPGPNESIVNYNGFEWKFFQQSFSVLSKSNHEVLSEVVNLEKNAIRSPESFISTPVHESFDDESPIVAVLSAIIPWENHFKHVLPEGADGMNVVINNDNQSFTFEIDGPNVHYMGPGDLHDTKYDHLEVVNAFAAYDHSKGDFGYTVHVYPTAHFEAEHTSIVYTCLVVAIFVFTALVFILYDFMVEKGKRLL
jgi:hypothetical protein